MAIIDPYIQQLVILLTFTSNEKIYYSNHSLLLNVIFVAESV